eukprot:CAMPEP_0204911836 /NCGR_PEP_ID=MMETSP1397-20131031/10096_1 /ASSEMBLY_ACC=CAM_ASM_000891 /TAXON_ID=49980 /ORGANISM="Climacostomum Climacostomum virens, Strain Stock W-24" /LENGTH=207 /DNA_ID=CAMNT_0052082533 /DNA_START=48 /DNA_END=668 /DNA_ORIENTATION=+
MLKSSKRLFATYLNYYKILGVNRNASSEEIKAAYRDLVKIYHPDLSTGNSEKFKEITQAFEVLKDALNRRAYDAVSTDRGQRSQSYNARDPKKTYDYRGGYASYRERAERAYEERMRKAYFYEEMSRGGPKKEEAVYTSRLSYYDKRQAIEDEYERRQRLEDQRAIESAKNFGLFMLGLGALAFLNMIRETMFFKHPSVSRSKSPYL